MYTRAYPPRNTAVPENYSGVALLSTDEEPTDNREEENEQSPAEEPAAAHTQAEEVSADVQVPPHRQQEDTPSIPLPTSFATSDLLLLAIAALMSQNGNADGELLMILLLLILGE